MLLLQSIFCLKGADNRSRFLALSAISYLIFSLFSGTLTNHFVMALCLLLLCSIVLTCTTIRRIRDARVNKNWRFISLILFLLMGVVVLLFGGASYFLLILPIVSSALLLTYPSKPQGDKSSYIYGYCGPVDLSEYIQEATNSTRRIEPTLASHGLINQEFETRATDNSERKYQDVKSKDSHFNQQQDNSSTKIDIGEQIRLKLLTNRKFQIGIAIIISLIVIAILISSISALLSDEDNTQILGTETSAQEQINNTKGHAGNNLIERSELLTMPDNFTLYLSQHQGLIINWQADEVANGELWSQQSIQGDKSCTAITFNKGDDVRTLQVAVENTNEYFAHFSPLDTKTLIKALAFRGNFTLCGYKFSLKGSQAVLGKNNSYGQYLD